MLGKYNWIIIIIFQSCKIRKSQSDKEVLQRLKKSSIFWAKLYHRCSNVPVCDLLPNGIAGVFGPRSESTANHIESICDAMEIPHIETRWDYKLNRDAFSINLYPHPFSLGQVRWNLVHIAVSSFVVNQYL